jgi:hypothetical protein
VHDALEDHAADEVLVVELRLVDLPASLGSEPEDALADRGDALDQRGFVGMLVAREYREARRSGDRLEHTIGKEVDQGDEEVARTHGRVADLEPKQARCRVQHGEVGKTLGLRAPLACKQLRFLPKGVDRAEHEGTYGALQDELNQDLVGVEGA